MCCEECVTLLALRGKYLVESVCPNEILTLPVANMFFRARYLKPLTSNSECGKWVIQASQFTERTSTIYVHADNRSTNQVTGHTHKQLAVFLHSQH